MHRMNELQSRIYKIRKCCNNPFTFHSLVSKNHNLSWSIWQKTNHIYVLESREKNTWRINSWQQLNDIIRSTPELDYQKCPRTASNFLVALNPWVRNKFSRWTYKIEKCSTHALNNHFPHAQHDVPCYSSALIYIAFAQVLCHPNQISN